MYGVIDKCIINLNILHNNSVLHGQMATLQNTFFIFLLHFKKSYIKMLYNFTSRKIRNKEGAVWH